MARGDPKATPGLAQQERTEERGALRAGLALILAFMAAEVVVGVLASSLALLSDAAHMLTDAAALALALGAAHLSQRPADGAMTYGMGRAEILSAQANGVTLLLLAVAIAFDAIRRLFGSPHVAGAPVLVVALVGIAVNLLVVRMLAPGGGHGHAHGSHGHAQGSHGHAHGQHPAGGGARSLNIEGAYRHVLTDLFGFAATAVAAAVILATGFARADAIASLLIAALMVHSGSGLVIASARVFMEAAPAGFDPATIGNALAAAPGIVEVHDLHVWEVTSGFPALSAHVVVRAGLDCHERRRELQRLLNDRFGIEHTTLQVDHEAAEQPLLAIEIAGLTGGPTGGLTGGPGARGPQGGAQLS